MSVDPKTKGITMLGRSDGELALHAFRLRRLLMCTCVCTGVLNPQGVRFGSAELYTIVEEMKDA